MNTVTSRDNKALKQARKLRRAKGRSEAGAFIADGRKLISEALASGLALKTLFVSENALEHGLAPGDLAFWEKISADVPAADVVCLAGRLYEEIAGTETPQPFAAVFEKPLPAEHIAGASVLVLDRIGDPGNAGTMVRTALAAGFAEVWTVKGTADLWSDKAIRASAGALFRMRLREGLEAESVLADARTAGIRVFALAMGGAELYEAELSGSVAIVVGNEGGGIQEAFSAGADAILTIPMAGDTESLNAAVAATVAMYEKHRQERLCAAI